MKTAGVKVKGLGGLYVIGTERHESRRIDLQLRGRCGRQGDTGSSRFYLSLEDDLMRIFAGDWVRAMMGKLGMGDGEPIESSFVSRRITAAQKKVEERNFEIRKNLLEYDEVMDQQRKRIYSYRQQILEGVTCRQLVLEQITQQIEHYVKMYTDPMFNAEAYTKWASAKLACQLEAKDFRSIDPGTAAIYAQDAAERAAETQVLDAIEENLPESESEDEWNWEALAKWCNTRYGTNYSAHELKKIPRSSIDEKMIERVYERLHAVDLSEGAALLHEDYGLQMLSGWMKNKFDLNVPIEEMRGKEPEEIRGKLIEMAERAYRQKESEYPVIVGLTRFGRVVGNNQFQLDQTSLASWASSRFGAEISGTEALGNTLNDVRELLVKHSVANYEAAEVASKQAKDKVKQLYSGRDGKLSVKEASGGNGAISSLADWFNEHLKIQLEADQLAKFDQESLERQVQQAIDDRFHPEIRRMERQVLLSIVDAAWKDHLLAMDHLRSAISLKSYAQMDPKVEYKREGMRMYGQMWFAIGERMTDLIFRMEHLDEDFVNSTWVETTARHDAAPSPIMQQQAADLAAADAAGTSEPQRIEPIRNDSTKVGRNDPCPCGSGKKYKACHGRHS